MFITFFPAFCYSQDASYSVRFGIATANMHQNEALDGHAFMAAFSRSMSQVNIEVGILFGRSMNEVLSTEQDIVNNPEKIREGYQISSMDFFSGVSYDAWNFSKFSFPIKVGLVSRIRTESYPDPEAETEVRFHTIDEEGNRKFTVMTEIIYTRSYELGLYTSLSANYRLNEQWKIALNNRYSFYTKGFSIYSLGISGIYSF